MVLLVSLFSFAALDQPVIGSLYQAVSAGARAVAGHFNFLTGVLGHGQSLDLVLGAYMRSALLLFTAVVLGGALGFGLGVAGGLNPGSRLSGVASAVSFLGILTPSFLLALLGLYVFIVYINPAVGIRFVLISPGVDVFHPQRLIPPALVLSVRPLALVAQVTIGALQEVAHTDFVRTAHAKGLLPRTVLLRHVLPNSALPVLTALNSSFFYALSSMLIVEWIFVWRGVGWWLLDAVKHHDALLASYLLVSVAVTLLVVNTAVKFVIGVVDPRVAESESVVT